MYYRVLKKEGVSFTDSSGRERRASLNSIIYMEQRTEVKRLRAAKSIKRVPDEQVEYDKNMMLVEVSEEDADAKAQDGDIELNLGGNSNSNVDAGEDEGESETLATGSIVQANIEGEIKTGEVLMLYKDKKIKVAFQDDSTNFRKMEAEELEVLG